MTQPISPALLHTYLTEDLSKTARCNRIKSHLYHLAAIVSLVVATAIFGMNLAAYYGLTKGASISLSQLGWTFLKFLFIGLNGIRLFSQSSEQTCLAKRNERIHAQLQTLQKWDDHQIRLFYQSKNRLIERLPVETMAKINQINPEQPHLALLPLIARYQVSESEGKKWNEQYSKLEKFRKEVEQDTKLTPAEKKDKLRRNNQAFLEYNVLGELLFYEPLHEKSSQFLGLPNELAKKPKRTAPTALKPRLAT